MTNVLYDALQQSREHFKSSLTKLIKPASNLILLSNINQCNTVTSLDIGRLCWEEKDFFLSMYYSCALLTSVIIQALLRGVCKQLLKTGRLSFWTVVHSLVKPHLKEVNKECKYGYSILFSKDIATFKVDCNPRDWERLYLHTTMRLLNIIQILTSKSYECCSIQVR